MSDQLIPTERIERSILLIRGQKVLLDEDLAKLYEVETKMLVRAVKRNVERFPPDFMFQLSSEEFRDLKYHFGTSSSWGGRRTPPYAFSEQGVAMLSGVLRSPRAVQVNIAIMRAFVRLREMLASNEEFARRLAALEAQYAAQNIQIQGVFEAIHQLMNPDLSEDPEDTSMVRRIGFHREEEEPEAE